MLALLEKLINEHGSSAILKERLGFVATQYAALERRNADLEAQTKAQHAELEQLKVRAKDIEAQLQALTKSTGMLVCDHCGNSNLTRVGSRPDPVFGDLGAKLAIYRCGACQGETAIAINP